MQPFERLERDFARFVGCEPEQMVVCSSGTAALHLALESLGIPEVGCVVVPDYTMIACPRAVSMARMVPMFADVDARSLTLCPNDMDFALDDAQAIMPVAVYGRSVHPSVFDLARKHDLKIVEDLAEAHGVPPHPSTDAACWSFYANKIVAGEEGGAVMFKDVHAANVARELRCLGFGPERDYWHRPHGHNYRLANALASLVGESLAHVKRNVERRRVCESVWDEATPDEWRMPRRQAPWVYDLRIPGIGWETQARLVRELRDQGIEARPGFKPMHLQDEFSRSHSRSPDFPNSSSASREIVYLPLLPVIDQATARSVVETIRIVVGR